MPESIPLNIKPSYPVYIPTDQIRTKFQEILGIDQIPSNIDFKMDASWEEDNLCFTKVKYMNCMGETIVAIIASPLEIKAKLLAGIVAMPGTSSSAEEVMNRKLYRPQPETGPLLGWGRELAKKGYVVISFTPKGTIQRRITSEKWEKETKLLAPYGISPIGILVDEAIRTALVLTSINGVDKNRIGFTGMSLGGLASWLSMSIAPWIKTSASVCGVLGMMEHMIHYGKSERHSSAIFIPHMLRYFDHPEIIAGCIAPRPFMMVAPTEDEDMPRSGVDKLMQIVMPEYEMIKHPEYFRVYQPSGIHSY